MDIILLAMLIVDALLLVGVIITQVRAKKNVIVNEVSDEILVEQPEVKKQDDKDEVVAVTTEETVEEIEDDTTDEVSEDLFASLSLNRKPAVPFYTKMLSADENLQQYYNTIRNEFKSYKGINARISKKGDTFRKGRELIAKLTLSGKTIKMYFKLNVADYSETKYHQRFAGDKKSYAEVPMCVKIKSDRGLKNALALINDLMSNESVNKKQRFTEINYLDTLKGLEENK